MTKNKTKVRSLAPSEFDAQTVQELIRERTINNDLTELNANLRRELEELGETNLSYEGALLTRDTRINGLFADISGISQVRDRALTQLAEMRAERDVLQSAYNEALDRIAELTEFPSRAWSCDRCGSQNPQGALALGNIVVCADCGEAGRAVECLAGEHCLDPFCAVHGLRPDATPSDGVPGDEMQRVFTETVGKLRQLADEVSDLPDDGALEASAFDALCRACSMAFEAVADALIAADDAVAVG